MKNPFKSSKRKEGKVRTGSSKSSDVSNSSSNSSKGKSASVQSTRTPQHAKKSLASSSVKSAPNRSESMTNSENGVGSGSNGSYSNGSPSSAKTETALNSKTKPQNEESGKDASALLSANAESKPTDIFPTGTHDANSDHFISQEPKLYLELNPTEIFDEPVVMKSYNSIPVLEMTRLPRGGVSFETEAVGRVQVSYHDPTPHRGDHRWMFLLTNIIFCLLNSVWYSPRNNQRQYAFGIRYSGCLYCPSGAILS
jgi:hypothetical protein